jgi:hypothetical protein
VLARGEKREQDVVALPVAILDVGELRVARADHVGLVAADEDHVLAGEPCLGEGIEDPLEDGAPEYRHQGLGDVVGEVLETASAAGTDDDGAHPL